MRCEDLSRELASPSGLNPAEMAGHLASCPACSEQSRRAARFDRIWEATRPLEPTADVMDALWARASAALDAPPVHATLRLEGMSRRRGWMKPALIFAQAAAILAAAVFLLRRLDVQPIQVADVVPAKVAVGPPLHVTPGEDQTAIVRIDKLQVVYHVYHEEEVGATTSQIPAGTEHGFFNAVEGMDSNAFESVASR